MSSMNGFRYLLFILLPGMIQAQVHFSQMLDSTAMLIGDQQSLHQFASGTDFLKDPLGQLDTLSWLEIIEVKPWVQSGASMFRRDILFTVFDSGSYRIPEFTVHFKEDSVAVNSLTLRVDFVRDSLNDLRPIKDIAETEGSFDGVWYLLSGLFFILIMLFLLYVLFKADQKTPSVVEYIQAESADQKALKALTELEKQKLWQQGEWKLYYDRLTEIIRTYLSDGFFLPARESSTSEIRNMLAQHEPPFQNWDELYQLLQKADLVKFANLKPDVAQLGWALEVAGHFIRRNAGMLESIRQSHLVTYRRFLGSPMADGFAFPDKEVDPGLQSIRLDGNTASLVLISSLVRKNTFVLPDAWVRLHQQKMGLLNRWHHNLVFQNYPAALTLLLLIPLLAVVSVFLPLLWVFSFWTRSRLISSGVFVLSKDRKLWVDSKSIL